MLDQRDMLGEQKTNCALRAAAEWHESPGRETDGPDQIDGANRRPLRAPVYFAGRTKRNRDWRNRFGEIDKKTLSLTVVEYSMRLVHN